MPKFVFMPPQDDLKAMFAARLADTVPDYEVVAPETDEDALEAIRDADARLRMDSARRARRRRETPMASQPRRRPLLRLLLR